MAFLFIGGEPEDFLLSGTYVPTTTSTHYRTAYARQSIAVNGSLSMYSNFAKASFTASSTVGATARVNLRASSATNVHFLYFASGGVARLRLRAASGTFPTAVVLEKWDGSSATTLATSTTSLQADTLVRLDMLVTYSASGRFRLWLDGTLTIDYTGDLTAGGSVNLDSLYLAGIHTATYATWSEVIITDGDDPRPLSLKTLVPNATGDVTGWTSGAFGDIDDVTASDLDLAVSDTALQILAVNATGMPSGASGLSVRAVKSVALAARGATGPSKLALGVRQSSTNAFASGVTLDTGYGTVSTTWTTNPVTSAAFTASEIDAIQLAYRSEA